MGLGKLMGGGCTRLFDVGQEGEELKVPRFGRLLGFPGAVDGLPFVKGGLNGRYCLLYTSPSPRDPE